MDGPVFASPDFAVPAFKIAVRLAVEAGLDAAAILDAKGKPLAVAVHSTTTRPAPSRHTQRGRSGVPICSDACCVARR
ncbi:MAG: hypothetical protein AB7T06_42135 [Kofleriaceae bacterium]